MQWEYGNPNDIGLNKLKSKPIYQFKKFFEPLKTLKSMKKARNSKVHKNSASKHFFLFKHFMHVLVRFKMVFWAFLKSTLIFEAF